MENQGNVENPAPQTPTAATLPTTAGLPPPVTSTSIHPFGNPLSTVLTVKLDDKNYMLWRKMVLAVLKGQRLDGFVLGTKKQPAEKISSTVEEVTTTSLNPEYETWCTMDQALLGWLYGSMIPTVAAEIINFSTTSEVWKALEDLFGSTNKARKQQLKAILQNTKKGSMKMTEYLTVMKQAADNLALAGAPVDIDDLTSSIVLGLSADYLPITCQINKDNLSWQELSSTLNTFENTLINLNVINYSTETSSFTANVAYSRPNMVSNNSSYRPTYQGRSSSNSRGTYR